MKIEILYFFNTCKILYFFPLNSIVGASWRVVLDNANEEGRDAVEGAEVDDRQETYGTEDTVTVLLENAGDVGEGSDETMEGVTVEPEIAFALNVVESKVGGRE